jgi:DNA repair protein RecN (Recombination protein N)
MSAALLTEQWNLFSNQTKISAMLRALTIQNVVLIERLEIAFREELCALTGETGAGKSILLDSLGLALGVRAETRLVRKGADLATVIAVFDTAATHPAFNIIKESGAAQIDEGEALILRRTLGKDGKSRAFINDQAVSAGLMRQVGETLVEIHGQFDTHAMLNPVTHRPMVDEYAGLTDKVRQMQMLWREWRAAQTALNDAEDEAERLRAEEDYLRHVVDELIKLAPVEGEEAELAKLKIALQNRDLVVEALNTAQKHLGSDNGADAMIQKAYRVIGRAEDKIGARSAEIMEAMDRASAELDSARNTIDSMFMDMEEEPYRFEEVDDRLYALRSAARKHDVTVDNLPVKLTELEAQLAHVEAQDNILSDLSIAAQKAEEAYENLARDIHEARKNCASTLDRDVMVELGPLKLDKARFITQVEEKPHEQWNEDGIDQVAFLIATNPGAQPGPLNKIASGGEMARFMLALKVVMAQVGSAGTLIFDEVDTGIGGAVADAVGERLARLAATHQIMVVTHSPQVAARGSHHWIVHKSGDDDVRTDITPLDSAQARCEEIARMLSGAHVTEEARAAADKLLQAKAA